MASPNAKRRIQTLLRGTKATTGYYGLGDLVANTDDIISKIYVAPDYTDADRTQIATWMARREIPVLSEYPRTNADLPCVFVFRTSDSETPNGILGYEGGCDEDLTTDETEYMQRVTMAEETIQLAVWAVGASMRDDLYLAVRELCFRAARGYFEGMGIEAPEWVNGKDGQMFRPEANPQIIHTAEATIRCRTTPSWTVEREAIKDVRMNLEGYNSGLVQINPFVNES